MAGMKILQFGFSAPDSPHLPHRFDAHTVVYTDAENPSSAFTLTFSLEGDVLTTHVDPDPDAGIEAVIFFNSAPFVRQP